MNKGLLVLLAGLVLGSAAFSGFYYAGTSSCREMLCHPQPELAWLKKEFKVSDAEFARIVQLHEAYLPPCAERCRKIEELNQKVQAALDQTGSVTSELRQLIGQRAALRAECESEMLKHFVEVSRTMPAEQGRRYLKWVQQQTLGQGQAMEQRHHSHPGHDSNTPE